MTLMSDKWIIEQSSKEVEPLIKPFVRESVATLNGNPVTSFGVSSYGYDLSLGNKFKIMKAPNQIPGARIINPCAFDQELFKDVVVEDGGVFVLPPMSFALAVSREHMCMPRDISGICMQKSTIARAGLEVVVTPLEAGWHGYLTLEFFNKTPYPMHLTPGMGIVQLLFIQGNEPCLVSYADRGGKYQDQAAEPVAPRKKEHPRGDVPGIVQCDKGERS